MRILVQKFGGSSVADLECMKKVRAKVLAELERGYKVVVVLSARYGQTNSLLEDVNDIAQSLDYAFGNEVRLYERINEFIGKSRAVYFGSTMLECPKCHKRPNFAEDHFVPWDMEHVFFGLCYQLLDQIARD